MTKEELKKDAKEALAKSTKGRRNDFPNKI